MKTWHCLVALLLLLALCFGLCWYWSSIGQDDAAMIMGMSMVLVGYGLGNIISFGVTYGWGKM